MNELGFDVGELNITTDVDGTRIVIQPKVVDAGHHHRQIMRLTGLDVGERQARRMLNDLHTYRALQGRNNEPLELVAHAWLNDVFEPTVRAVPNELKGKREPAQIFHEVLDHRWYLAQQQQRDVPLPEATKSYIKNVLPSRVDEELYLDPGVQDTLY